MTLALVDCPTGLAGNMLLAALMDLGLPEAVVAAPLAALGFDGRYRLQLEERRSAGQRGLHLAVEGLEAEPPQRLWGDLRLALETAPLEAALRRRVLAVFGALARAEAAVHGLPEAQVHFHEVGAIDALVDVVGVCAGLAHFGVEQLVCTPPPAGHGQVTTAHGQLPLPAPAVLELARGAGVPLASSAAFPPGELTTPTGLALMVAWADRFAQAPALRPRAVGIGLGSRPLDRPNLLRLVLADPLELAPLDAASATMGMGAPVLETVLLQQAQLDDITPEDAAYLVTALRQAGALEVFSQPVQMKKGRAGLLLTVLALPDQGETLRRIWWCHGTSLGVREQLQQRWVLPRRQILLPTPWGPVRIKQAQRPDGRWTSKAEHDDLVALAEARGLGLAEVRREVEALLAEAGAHPAGAPNPEP